VHSSAHTVSAGAVMSVTTLMLFKRCSYMCHTDQNHLDGTGVCWLGASKSVLVVVSARAGTPT
jgi:hypothetical protein